MTTEADMAAMEGEFRILMGDCTEEVDPRDALQIARRYPKAAAISGAVVTYAVGYRVKLDQPITAKDPMKSGPALWLSKSTHFANCDQLIQSFELAFTQTGYDREAALIAMVPCMNASLQLSFDNGLTRREFTLLTEVAVWMAGSISQNLTKDVIAIGKALRR